MNEVKQVWLSLRSPRHSVINPSNSNTTWYDVPTPVIIHNREFTTENMDSEYAKDDDHKSTGKVRQQEDLTHRGRPKEANLAQEEVLYQNNVEAALNSLSKVCVEPLKTGMDLDIGCPDVVNSDAERDSNSSTEASAKKRRHSSSIEVTATSSLQVDADGMPTISFSFLCPDEKDSRISNVNETKKEIEYPDNDTSQDVPVDALYDFPKSPRKESPEKQDTVKTKPNEKAGDISSPGAHSIVQDDLYDIPKSPKIMISTSSPHGEDQVEENRESEPQSALKPPNPEAEEADEQLLTVSRKKSRSRIIRRSLEEAETKHPDRLGDTTSMSGSCSDLESPGGQSDETARRSKRLKRQKRRLGKAWGKMRSWLREEKTRLGEIVTTHARMQAVGAMQADADERLSTSKSKSGSYDLTKSRSFDPGSITKVEEFGLSSVSEEANVSDVERPCNDDFDRSNERSPGSADYGTNETDDSPKVLGLKTMSSDDLLGGGKSRLRPVSFSLDKLCSDGENDEKNVPREQDARDQVGKGGLIRRRMLGSIRGLMASTHLLQTHEIEEGGQGGFEDVRRYVKQGGDFCKELAAILHERAELEATYAKGLTKLSSKLTKACTKDQGGVNEAWRGVGDEMEAAAEAHRVWGLALGEQLAKPLRVGVAEAQGRSRKLIETSVDKASKSLQEWRNVAAKSKKQSFSCARENERFQDLARLQTLSHGQQNNNKSSNHQMTEKEANKLESRKRKAEDASRRADTEFYTVSVRAERARLEYENTVRKGAKQMELLEEERLRALKDFANVYLAHLQALAPRLQQSADRLSTPVRSCSVSQDVEILKNLTRRIDSNESSNAEQLLPDFYAEHVTLAMNRERRKQALVRVLHLIRQDLERERRGREGLETLHRAFIKTPAFAADESTQNVSDKLHHMRSMLTYLEAAKYKVGGALSEIEGGKRGKHPLAEHILVSRDKQGLQQSVLKVPAWAKNESLEQLQETQDELEEHLTKVHESDNRDWADRTAGDGNSENRPDEEDFSDFDEFSSHSEDNNNQEIESTNVTPKNNKIEQCRAVYQYSANLNDELSLNPGDLITIHEKQADGWWVGECRGRTGIFPATYVQVVL